MMTKPQRETLAALQSLGRRRFHSPFEVVIARFRAEKENRSEHSMACCLLGTERILHRFASQGEIEPKGGLITTKHGFALHIGTSYKAKKK